MGRPILKNREGRLEWDFGLGLPIITIRLLGAQRLPSRVRERGCGERVEERMKNFGLVWLEVEMEMGKVGKWSVRSTLAIVMYKLGTRGKKKKTYV